jgi:hypothetical protein
LANALGKNGKKYVESMYAWDSVLDRFEATVKIAQKNFGKDR